MEGKWPGETWPRGHVNVGSLKVAQKLLQLAGRNKSSTDMILLVHGSLVLQTQSNGGRVGENRLEANDYTVAISYVH